MKIALEYEGPICRFGGNNKNWAVDKILRTSKFEQIVELKELNQRTKIQRSKKRDIICCSNCSNKYYSGAVADQGVQ
ncbi:hypothetical protein SDJN02_17574, partial [Cucurbita argyrosperma subsp. argyrosperma]